MAEVERNGLAGLAIALIKDGEQVWSKACGAASIETGVLLAPEMPFAIMSVTKTIVSTALMQLRDEGHFHLDDPVNKHLGPVRVQNQWEAERPVRVRDLMTHTSGLPVGGLASSTKLPLAEFVSAYARCERRPGEAIVYANWGFDVIGVLIERLSGMAVGDYLRERVFEPLGMTTALFGNPEPEPTHATGHLRSLMDGKVRTLPLPDWWTIPATPAGGCWMSVGDLAKFVAAHLSDGGPLLSAETAAEMHRLHFPQGRSDSGQGLGFRVTRSNGRRLICHGGDGGGFTAFIGAYPEERAGVVLLINTAGMQGARSVVGNTALALLAGEPRRRTSDAAAIPEGVYRSTWWDMLIEARNLERPTLTATEGLVLADENAVSTLELAGEGRFQAEGGIFHGFEVAVQDGEITGGVYPYTFVREGDLPSGEDIVHEQANMTGVWKGAIRTPVGPLAVVLEINRTSEATVSSPFGQNIALENVNAEKGHLEGEFKMSVPGYGELRNFVRLFSLHGHLAGRVFLCSDAGEVAASVELERA